LLLVRSRPCLYRHEPSNCAGMRSEVTEQDRVCYARLSSFFFNDTATTEIYTLSLHDALPISWGGIMPRSSPRRRASRCGACGPGDRKSTRLNSSHLGISYAVFCLKKKTT